MSVVISGDAATTRTALGYGTAAALNTGTSANQVVVLDGSAKLPAVDGSNLTGISSTPFDTANIVSLLAVKTGASNNAWYDAKSSSMTVYEISDPDGVYDSSTGRFQPTTAGKYFISLAGNLSCGNNNFQRCSIRVVKNGSTNDIYAERFKDSRYHSEVGVVKGSTIIDMNGSTDYLEPKILKTDVSGSGNLHFLFQAFRID